MVSAGSADRFVYIWDTTTRRILYKLPGHLGSVNDVDFHKVEPISKSNTLYQTSANNSTPPRYSKNIPYSAIIRGRMVGLIVAQYLTRGRVRYLYYRRIWGIVVVESDGGIRVFDHLWVVVK